MKIRPIKITDISSFKKGIVVWPIKFKLIEFVNIFLLTAFFLYLEMIYKNFVHKEFPYLGFAYAFSISRYLETKVFFIIAVLLLHHRKISKFIYALLYVIIMLMLIPNLILYEFMCGQKIIVYSILALEICIILFNRKTYNFKLPKLKQSQHIWSLFIITIIMLVPFFITYGFKFDMNVLLFRDIYETRSVSAAKSNILTAYSYAWLGKVIIPIMLVYALVYKKKFLAFFSVISLVYLFLVSPHKTIFVIIAIILFFYFSATYHKKVFFLLVSVLSLFIVARIISVSFDSVLIESLLTRRIFFVPALLNILYFNFFEHNYLYLSHSVLSPFFHYPYELSPANLIGSVYFNSPTTSANNGIISDGYMNFGILGIAVYIVLASLLIKVINSLNISPRFFGVFFVLMFTFTSSAFLSIFLTHGGFILIVLCLFLLKDTQNKTLYEK